MSVIHWGKQNVSNALTAQIYSLFVTCGSIWSTIDIKGCLRISVHKLGRLCELTLFIYKRFSPDWFVSLFQVRFWTLIPAFPRVSAVLWFVIFTRSVDKRMRLRNSFSRRNQSTFIILVTDYWSLSKQYKCSASTSNENINSFLQMQIC